jgi:hypothetical protein
VRELLAGLPERDSIEALIVISQPGAIDRLAPFVVDSSTGEQSGSVQLKRSAQRSVEVQAGEPSPQVGAFTQLARLAIPSGLGDQAPLIADGVDAVAISSAGETPLASNADQLDDLSPKTVDEFGRAVQSTVAAVDVAVADPVHGPEAYLDLGDNLVPGWALAALALALILPAGAAAIDACARAGREDRAIGAAIAWAAARALPFVGALATLYALAIVGAIPRPEFPFDPGLYELGPRAVIVFCAIVAVLAASAWLLRSRGITARRAPEPAVAGLGAIAVLAGAAVWLANPYLALLAAPLVHVWLLVPRGPGTAMRIVAVAATAVACVPVIAAVVAVGSALDLGPDAPWTFVLMVADGQIGLATTLALCFLAGVVAGVIALSIRRTPAIPAEA